MRDSSSKGGNKKKLNLKPAEKEQFDLVKDFKPQWDDAEVRAFCEKYNFNADDICSGLQNAYEDERIGHQEADWQVMSKEKKAKKPKEEKRKEARDTRSRREAPKDTNFRGDKRPPFKQRTATAPGRPGTRPAPSTAGVAVSAATAAAVVATSTATSANPPTSFAAAAAVGTVSNPLSVVGVQIKTPLASTYDAKSEYAPLSNSSFAATAAVGKPAPTTAAAAAARPASSQALAGGGFKASYAASLGASRPVTAPTAKAAPTAAAAAAGSSPVNRTVGAAAVVPPVAAAPAAVSTPAPVTAAAEAAAEAASPATSNSATATSTPVTATSPTISSKAPIGSSPHRAGYDSGFRTTSVQPSRVWRKKSDTKDGETHVAPITAGAVGISAMNQEHKPGLVDHLLAGSHNVIMPSSTPEPAGLGIQFGNFGLSSSQSSTAQASASEAAQSSSTDASKTSEFASASFNPATSTAAPTTSASSDDEVADSTDAADGPVFASYDYSQKNNANPQSQAKEGLSGEFAASASAASTNAGPTAAADAASSSAPTAASTSRPDVSQYGQYEQQYGQYGQQYAQQSYNQYGQYGMYNNSANNSSADGSSQEYYMNDQFNQQQYRNQGRNRGGPAANYNNMQQRRSSNQNVKGNSDLDNNMMNGAGNNSGSPSSNATSTNKQPYNKQPYNKSLPYNKQNGAPAYNNKSIGATQQARNKQQPPQHPYHVQATQPVHGYQAANMYGGYPYMAGPYGYQPQTATYPPGFNRMPAYGYQTPNAYNFAPNPVYPGSPSPTGFEDYDYSKQNTHMAYPGDGQQPPMPNGQQGAEWSGNDSNSKQGTLPQTQPHTQNASSSLASSNNNGSLSSHNNTAAPGVNKNPKGPHVGSYDANDFNNQFGYFSPQSAHMPMHAQAQPYQGFSQYGQQPQHMMHVSQSAYNGGGYQDHSRQYQGNWSAN